MPVAVPASLWEGDDWCRRTELCQRFEEGFVFGIGRERLVFSVQKDQ